MDEKAIFEGIKSGNFSDFIEVIRAHQTPLYAYLLATQNESRLIENHFTSLFTGLLSKILKSRKPFPLKEWLFGQAHLKASSAVTTSMSDDPDIETRLRNLGLAELELFFLKIQLGFSFSECEAILLQPVVNLKAIFDQSFSHLYPDLNFTSASTPECTKFGASLVDYLCRTLPASERDQTTRHTQYCSDCSSRLGRLAPFFRAIESFAPPAPPANLSINLNEKTRNLYNIYLSRLKDRRNRRKLLIPVYVFLFFMLIFLVYKPIKSFFSSYFQIRDKNSRLVKTMDHTPSKLPTNGDGIIPFQDGVNLGDNYTTNLPNPVQPMIAPKKDKLSLPQAPEFDNIDHQPNLDSTTQLHQPKADSNPSPAPLGQSQPSLTINDNATHGATSNTTDNQEPSDDVPSVADTADLNDDDQKKLADTEVAPALPMDGSKKNKSPALPEKGCPISSKIDDESSEIIQTLNEIMKIHNDALRVTTGLSPNPLKGASLESDMTYNVKISESFMMGKWFRTYIDLKARFKEWEELELVQGADDAQIDMENVPSDEWSYNNYIESLQYNLNRPNNTDLFSMTKKLSSFTLTDPVLNTSVSFEIYESNSSDIYPMEVIQEPSCRP